MIAGTQAVANTNTEKNMRLTEIKEKTDSCSV